MASTKGREGTQPKSRLSTVSSSPQPIPAPHGRQSPKPGSRSPQASSPVNRQLPGKPTPNNLKPKATSSSDVVRSVKSQQTTPSTAGTKRVPLKKPVEKPPSPSRQPQRTQSTPITLRDIRSPPLGVPRPSISSKPGADKAPKVAKSGRTGQLTRVKSLERKSDHVVSANSITLPQVDDDLIPNAYEEAAIKNAKEAKEGRIVSAAVDGNVSNMPEDSSQDPNNIAVAEENQVEFPEAKKDAEVILTDLDSTPQPTKKSFEVKAKQNHEDEEKKKDHKAEEAIQELEKECKDHVAKPRIEEARLVKPDVAKEAPMRSGGGWKRDAPRSNDVIEEVKSKFMGNRRNKVLALVGAFETVMQSQEPESQQGQQQWKGGKPAESEQGQQEAKTGEKSDIQQDLQIEKKDGKTSDIQLDQQIEEKNQEATEEQQGQQEEKDEETMECQHGHQEEQSEETMGGQHDHQENKSDRQEEKSEEIIEGQHDHQGEKSEEIMKGQPGQQDEEGGEATDGQIGLQEEKVGEGEEENIKGSS